MSYPAMCRAPAKERGISLIELMVTLVISSFLVIGMTQLYVDNQRSYAFQQSQSGNQEASRFAEFLFNEYLGKAGYRRAPDQSIDDAFPQQAANSDCKAFATGESVTATAAADGICIRYEPLTKSDLDCQGNTVKDFDDTDIFTPAPASSLVTLVIRYQAADAGAGVETGKLTCKSLNSTAAAYVELLEGVADFRLDFGLGDKGSLEKILKEDGDANRFKTASDWSSNDGPIRAVRYSILLASGEKQRDSDDSAVLTNWLSEADATAKDRLQAGDNRRIYQIAHNTQSMRNLMP